MKGLFRGLKCIFDTDNEKEPKIQIGAPTDVKHVAHIGCDGPSTHAPSWMNEYQGGSESQPGDTNAGSKAHGSGGGTTDSTSRSHKTKQTKRSGHGNESSHHKPRKNKSNTSETSVNESSRTRRLKNSLLGSESPAPETDVKRTRKKQGEGTTRSSKNRNKDPSTTDAATWSDSGCSDGVCQKPRD
ncbi:hypothetical protein L1987_37645 [Smallanthus sonchifolius]|uniref:Uncharacterized protein n=1 Tax=Smallanthus sonchifolius TaxID=185202 RepID=A0ACB9HHC6_9ASTR|nr:hypothetical protein L1987_37645 [Smallanthus sonchifolius]